MGDLHTGITNQNTFDIFWTLPFRFFYRSISHFLTSSRLVSIFIFFIRFLVIGSFLLKNGFSNHLRKRRKMEKVFFFFIYVTRNRKGSLWRSRGMSYGQNHLMRSRIRSRYYERGKKIWVIFAARDSGPALTRNRWRFSIQRKKFLQDKFM